MIIRYYDSFLTGSCLDCILLFFIRFHHQHIAIYKLCMSILLKWEMSFSLHMLAILDYAFCGTRMVLNDILSDLPSF